MALLFMLCLENIGSHSYADFPDVDTFCYMTEEKKKPCSLSPWSRQKKLSVLRSCPDHGVGYNFSTILIFS